MARYFWLLIATLCVGDTYTVTYRAVYYNGALETEMVWIVPSLEDNSTTFSSPSFNLCFSPTVSLKALNHEEKTFLVQQLSQQGFFVTDGVVLKNGHSRSRTVLTYPPTRVSVEFDSTCKP